MEFGKLIPSTQLKSWEDHFDNEDSMLLMVSGVLQYVDVENLVEWRICRKR